MKCEICNKELKHKYSLKKHYKNIHNSIYIMKHKCRFCGKQFEKSTSVSGHQIHCDLNPEKYNIRKTIGNLSKNRHHSKQTRKKLSDIRLKFLQEHPDKVPYLLNHSSKRSYPEIVFENALKESGLIGWIVKYRAGIYEYDFAFPELKIDIEIDGATHLTEKVKIIDKRRDIWSKEQGWKVIRFTAKKVKENVISCINCIRNSMAE